VDGGKREKGKFLETTRRSKLWNIENQLSKYPNNASEQVVLATPRTVQIYPY
jgi:hypothetical protein